MSYLFSVPTEIPIIKREHFNRWYSLKAYYLAITLSDAPIQLVSTLVYAIITFLLTGQPIEMFRLCYFIVICILISLVAQSIGLLNGAVFNIQVKHFINIIVKSNFQKCILYRMESFSDLYLCYRSQYFRAFLFICTTLIQRFNGYSMYPISSMDSKVLC